MDQQVKAQLTRTAVTLAIAAVGGTAFGLIGLPSGWMTGGMVAVAVAAMLRVPVAVPKPLQNAQMLVIGSLLGTSVSPELLRELWHWPISLALLCVSVLLTQVATESFLRRFYRWDRLTAFFASVPGLTSYIVSLALPTRADLSRIAVSQTVRVFLLVLLMPNLLNALNAVGGVAAPPAVPHGSVLDVAGTLIVGVVGGILMSYVGIPAALLIGAMVAAGALHGTGILHGTLPPVVQIPVYISLGALIGVRFAGTTLATLRSMLMPSLGAFAAGLVVSFGCAWVSWMLVGAPMSQLLLAFAPGGIDIMTTVAFSLGLDSAFVAGHQLARFLAITVYVPFLLPRAGGGRRDDRPAT